MIFYTLKLRFLACWNILRGRGTICGVHFYPGTVIILNEKDKDAIKVSNCTFHFDVDKSIQLITCVNLAGDVKNDD